jgi:DNA-binding NarL/FixJ family response regulator
MTIRVLIADDQAMVRAGFKMLLAGEAGIEVVAEARDGLEAVAQAARFHPTVILTRPPILRAVFSTAFDVLKCSAAARTGSEGAIAACISFSGGELLIKFIHAALNAVPAGRAFLDKPFPVQS